MSQTTGISKNLFAVGLIVAILVSTILSVGIATQLGIKGPKGDTGATGLQGPIGPAGTSSSSTSTGGNNQVQVSGTISGVQSGTVTFYDGDSPSSSIISSSSPIVNGHYSVVLVGGKSYTVEAPNNYYSIYVPTGVTTFTADF